MSAFSLACDVPWAITPAALELILDIASRERLGESELSALESQAGKKFDNSRIGHKRGSVGVIPIAGPIFRHASMFTRLSGATAVSDLAADLKALADDESVKSILLSIGSPGGEVAGIEEFAAYIRQADGKKPVLAYVDSQAASAAYWIASAARSIHASQTSSVGSIGVVMVYRDTRKALERAGVSDIEIVSSQSPRKRPDPTTEVGRSQIQERVDDLADIFVGAVAKNRGVKPSAVLTKFGKGGEMIASKALNAGMIDSITYEEDLIARMNAGDIPDRGDSDHGERVGSEAGSARAGGFPMAHARPGVPFRRLRRLI